MKPDFTPEILQADVDHVWHPMIQHKGLDKQPPKLMVRAEGSTITDAAGRNYLDAMAGLWCVNVGYGRREIADAIYAQLLELPYYPHIHANSPAALLAERLAELTGETLPHSYFVNSGTEAIEAAMKLARQYQRQARPGQSRYKTISRYYSYHGTSLSALAVGGMSERKKKYEPLGDGFVHVPPAYCYRCPYGLTYPSCNLACAKQVEYAIQAEGPESVVAVVMEPIQSGIGVLVPPDEYLPEVAATCKKHGVLLILDEVINGFGRTGKWFAHQHYGITPDLMAVAKGITSGYQPMGAVLATDEVFSAFLGDPSEERQAVQVNTWGGHAAAAAGALKNLEIIEREQLPEHAAIVGAHLLDGLEGLLDLPLVGDVRGKGLLIGVELVADKATRAPLGGPGMLAVLKGCSERGLLVGRSGGTGGGFGNTITLCPPLVLTVAEADEIVATLAEVLGAR